MNDSANRCNAITKAGTRCQARAITGSDRCFFHNDPAKLHQASVNGGNAKAARPWYAKHKLDSKEDLGEYLHAALIEATKGGLSIRQAEALSAVAPALGSMLPSSRTSKASKPATAVLGPSTGDGGCHV